MYKSIALITILVAVLSLHQVYANGTCAAQANFDECKNIQNSVLSKCGPVDYKCQCDAQRLILQCYDLCPNYSSEASIQSASVQGICAAVPASSSAVPVASSTANSVVAAATTAAASSSVASPAASSSPSANHSTSTSSATNIHPVAVLTIACMAIGLLQL
ncbi:hypothetical protein G6F29_010288 [Rhizopus arrhizus]|nr:hypothetical protein G6F29_010288 [Rhizopus arrhizus]